MSDITPISPPAAARAAAASRAPSAAAPPRSAVARADDQVEFSVAAQLLSKINELPAVRQELIARVRADIDAETYETPAKWDKALQGLLRDLR